MKPAALAIIAVSYLASLGLAIVIVLNGSTYFADLHNQATSAKMAFTQAVPHDDLDAARLKLSAKLSKARDKIKTLCQNTDASNDDDDQAPLLALSHRLRPILGNAVTLAAYSLATPAPGAPADASTPVAATTSATTPPSLSGATPGAAPSASPAVSTVAVTARNHVDITLHGPSPAIFHALDNLAHSDDALAYSLTNVTRAQDGLTDAHLTIVTNRLPAGVCS